jgi:hypothetical protein
VARFYLDVLDGDRVIEDPEGIDFANLEAAISEATAGARDLVAHGIMQNEDVSGQVFRIRDGKGETVATVPFRDTLPGRLRDSVSVCASRPRALRSTCRSRQTC